MPPRAALSGMWNYLFGGDKAPEQPQPEQQSPTPTTEQFNPVDGTVNREYLEQFQKGGQWDDAGNYFANSPRASDFMWSQNPDTGRYSQVRNPRGGGGLISMTPTVGSGAGMIASTVNQLANPGAGINALASAATTNEVPPAPPTNVATTNPVPDTQTLEALFGGQGDATKLALRSTTSQPIPLEEVEQQQIPQQQEEPSWWSSPDGQNKGFQNIFNFV